MSTIDTSFYAPIVLGADAVTVGGSVLPGFVSREVDINQHQASHGPHWTVTFRLGTQTPPLFSSLVWPTEDVIAQTISRTDDSLDTQIVVGLSWIAVDGNVIPVPPTEPSEPRVKVLVQLEDYWEVEFAIATGVEPQRVNGGDQ